MLCEDVLHTNDIKVGENVEKGNGTFVQNVIHAGKREALLMVVSLFGNSINYLQ